MDPKAIKIGDIVRISAERFNVFGGYPPSMGGDLLVSDIMSENGDIEVLCMDGNYRMVESFSDLEV